MPEFALDAAGQERRAVRAGWDDRDDHVGQVDELEVAGETPALREGRMPSVRFSEVPIRDSLCLATPAL